MSLSSGKENQWTGRHIQWLFVILYCSYSLTHQGKPWVFQWWQYSIDKKNGVIYATDIPRAPSVLLNAPQKVKAVYGPSRLPHQYHLPWDHGTNWGGDWRNGRAWKDLGEADRNTRVAPPKYSEVATQAFDANRNIVKLDIANSSED